MSENDAESPVKKGPRLSATAQCIRKTVNTLRLPFSAMPDSPKFNPADITSDYSAKFTRLIAKIRDLDNADMQTHGTLFKHFIYTDIRESVYGAKAIASFLIAAGFELRMGWQDKYMKLHGKMVKTKDGETVYKPQAAVPGGSNGFALLQSLPLWHTPLSSETKKTVLKAFNARPTNVHGEHIRMIVLDSKYKEGIDLFDVKYVHLMEPALATSDLKQAVGRATRFCGQMGLPFLPRRGWPLHVYIYNMTLPEDAHELMMSHSGIDLALLNITNELTRLAIQTAVDYDLSYNINNFEIESALMEAADIEAVAEVAPAQVAGARPKLVAVHTADELTDELLTKCTKSKSVLFPFTVKQMKTVAAAQGLPLTRTRNTYCDYMRGVPGYLSALIKHTRRAPSPIPVIEDDAPLFPKPASPAPSPKHAVKDSAALGAELERLRALPFSEFQTGVTGLYNKFRWESPVVKSGCPPKSSGKAAAFTKTQDFVRHYLTPQSPFKGLFAWHSVGTGKTCMAVAAATTYFEQAGYTILWVTRNALMADVYKNLFGLVCSIPNMEKLKQGKTLPEELGAQRRALGRTWIPPISYRMFQNALEQKNELGRVLHAKHPDDPLHKTFLIIDEIHKLQDGDLSASEAADFATIQSYIHKSYAASGSDSVRPLLMTATPITDSPAGLFDILNTLIPAKEERLVPFNEFRARYTDDGGVISGAGRDYFQQRAKGLVSYLNREYDPTSFSQPIFETLMVDPTGEKRVPSVAELAEQCISNMPIDALLAEQITEQDCNQIIRSETELIKTQVKQMKEQVAGIKKDKAKPAEVKDAEIDFLTDEIAKLQSETHKVKEKHAVSLYKCKQFNKDLADKVKRTRKTGTHGIMGAMEQCYEHHKMQFQKTQSSKQLDTIRACLKGRGAAAATRKNKAEMAYVNKQEFMQTVEQRLFPQQ
jgi:hypothetical protein